MRELFVYYRLHSENAAAAQAAVASFQAQLRRQHPSLLTRLLQRSEEADGQQTWMETYATDPMLEPNGVNADMQITIDAHAAVLGPWLAGPRHIEVFIACVL